MHIAKQTSALRYIELWEYVRKTQRFMIRYMHIKQGGAAEGTKFLCKNVTFVFEIRYT